MDIHTPTLAERRDLNEKFVLSLISSVIFVMLSASAFGASDLEATDRDKSVTSPAATRPGYFTKWVTTGNYYGIGGTLVIPSEATAKNGNVINFQMGLADKVEGGISYSDAGWKVFLNTEYGACLSNNTEAACSKYWRSIPLTAQPQAGDQLNLKIVNNGNGTVSYYLNGSTDFNGYSWANMPVFGRLSVTTPVKILHIASDLGGTTKYKNAEWKNVVLRANASGSTYTNWTTSVGKTAHHQNSSYFTILSSIDPLKTSFQAP